jgi:predicted RNA-binding Zn-ribbon protein involved in translation (DUF1610 family)
MKFILSKSVHPVCPSCGSSDVSRSKKKGLFELTLSSIFRIKPYRCARCDYRHFRFRPASGHVRGHSLPSAPK